MTAALDELEVRWARGPGDLAAALALREEVFCREQGVPIELEIDGRDENALHLLARDPASGHVAGTLRLLLEQRRAQIGRVAVEARWRRRGVASRMLALALERASREGCSRALLAAQLQATGVYERAGFEVESEPFEEAGIAHVWMGCSLTGDRQV